MPVLGHDDRLRKKAEIEALGESMRVTDFPLAIALLALSAALAIAALSFPPMAGQAFEPKLFPNMIAAALAICAALLIARALRVKQLRFGWVRPVCWGAPGRLGSLV
jgi:hypothetical protein